MVSSRLRWSAKAAIGVVAAAAVVASCTNTADETTTTIELTTTTTFAPIEIVPISTTIAPGVDPGVHEQLMGLLEELAAATQNLRGLSYIQLPAVAIVAAD